MGTDSHRANAADSKVEPVLDVPGGNLALDLFVLSQHLGSMLDAAFADTEVTPSQYAVYSQLAHGPRTPGQIAQTLGLRPATLSGYLASMQDRGHATRTRSTTDGRSSLVALTPEGNRERNACRVRMRRAVTHLDAEVGSAAEVTNLRLTLGRLDDAVLAATGDLARRTR